MDLNTITAEAYIECGDYEKAALHLEKVLSIDETNADALNNYAVLLIMKEEY